MRMGDVPSNNAVNANVPWYRQIIADLGKALPGLATTYLSIQQQKDLQKINIQRQAMGIAPLSIDDYAPQVQAGLNRSTQNTILIVAAGIAGAVVLSSLVRGRRR